MTKIHSKLAEMRKGLVCLVPRPNAESVITSHERTLCDCQVLEIITALEQALESEARLADWIKGNVDEVDHPQDHALGLQLVTDFRKRHE
jgi:hypothetical protein